MTESQEDFALHPDERRVGLDRRQGQADTRPNEERYERRSGWDRRRGPGRRRTDERRAAEEGEMNDEQFEFLMAINEYKKANKVPFPSFTEILEIAKALGYRKVAEPVPLNTLLKDESND
jgi:hypothetical protein